jgi:two-component system, chemotaxis family, CheB/CheR fusion protein
LATVAEAARLASRGFSINELADRAGLQLLCPVAAIGCAAGGLDSVMELLTALPPKSDVAYVIIHSSRAESLRPESLGSLAPMPIALVRDGSSIESGRIYIVPAGVTATLVSDHFQLVEFSGETDSHCPVDAFLESLAADRGDTAIGVILAGAGGDGRKGVRALKHSGGIVYAQSLDSTRSPHMPRAAIETGCVDFVLRPSEIGAELMRLNAHPYLRGVATAQPSADISARMGPPRDDESLPLIFRRLRTAHGVDFSHYKLSTLRRRLARRMALRKVDDLAAYITLLEDDAAETAALYQDFLIRVTGFFRDAQSFEGLRTRVFPSLTEMRSEKDPIRIWVPGCATGEETYSIAIALVEYLSERLPAARIQLFGTDVSDAAIEKARAAFYHKSLVEHLPSHIVERFFVAQDDHYRIAKSIRELCIFARQDVTRDPPFSRTDLISCRNLLIYLDAPAQRHVMQVFHYSLRPQGFLMLGPSESVGSASDLFELFDRHHRFYRRKAMPPGAGLELAPRGRSPYSRSRSVPPGDDLIVEAESSQREADRLLLAQYAPASLLVDESLNILQYRGETGRYVEHASGPPSHNLTRIVRPELLVELSPAIQEARESGSAVRREGLTIDELTDISLQVTPLKISSTQRCYLIVFEDAARRANGRRLPQAPGSALPESEKDRRLIQYERELAATRDYLQATIEEQEAVKEELRSAHEEVLSANEEYQSTNEELETAKEELQSANEELTSTNDELRNRNRELSSLNAELQRMRDSSDRGRAYAEALVESLREPLVVLDQQLTLVRANEAFFSDFSIDRNAAVGRPLTVVADRMWNIPELLSQLTQVIHHDAVVEGLRLKLRVPETGLRSLRLKACKVPDDAERGALILIAIQDVTEIEATTDQLREADQRKDEFLATLAHELRNPLAPITHALHLLQRSGSQLDAAGLHELMSRQTRRLVRLVDELLDVAKIRRGDIDIQAETVDLTDSVRHAIEATRPRIEERGHELSIDLPATPLYVRGDPVRLEQVVSNVLENATKYTPEGGRVGLQINTRNRVAEVRIKDTGIGLAPEHLEKIFDLFARIDSSVSRTTGGLGIGLSLVRRVLALHGGSITAHSAGLGLGTEFVIQLPLSAQAGRSEPLAPAEPQLPGRTQVRHRVLIVDDNADSLEPLVFLVRSWGHEVAQARDGLTALEVAEQFRPDRALVDIGMPGMSGYDLARRLRSQARHRDLLLIAITGHGRAEDRKQAYAAGFDAHFVKPADLQELSELLANGGAAEVR